MLKLLRFTVLVSQEHLALGKQRAPLTLLWRMFQLRRRRWLCLISHQVTPEKMNPRMKVVKRKEGAKSGKKRSQKGVRSGILVIRMTRGNTGKTRRKGGMTLILINMFIKF